MLRQSSEQSATGAIAEGTKHGIQAIISGNSTAGSA
jgi:hypothetical protein